MTAQPTLAHATARRLELPDHYDCPVIAYERPDRPGCWVWRSPTVPDGICQGRVVARPDGSPEADRRIMWVPASPFGDHGVALRFVLEAEAAHGDVPVDLTDWPQQGGRYGYYLCTSARPRPARAPGSWLHPEAADGRCPACGAE